MTVHAPSLMQQLEAIREEVGKLPLTIAADPTMYPSSLQQAALLKRAQDDITHALWAIEEYNGGRQLGAVKHQIDVIK